MLRSVVGNMLSLRTTLLLVSSVPFVLSQNYILQDDYTIPNFFNMFSFYTASGRIIGTIHVLRLTHFRTMTPLMAMFNM
jgi:uncharacterized protein Usg